MALHSLALIPFATIDTFYVLPGISITSDQYTDQELGTIDTWQVCFFWICFGIELEISFS